MGQLNMRKSAQIIAYTLTISAIVTLVVAVYLRGEVQGSFPAGEAFLLIPVRTDAAWELLSIDAATKQDARSEPLPGEPSTVRPTPGGVSVFLGFRDSRTVSVLNTATMGMEYQWDAHTGAVTEISFSPDGSRLFLLTDTGYLETYEHRRGEVTLLTASPLGTPHPTGPVFTDSRGTRLYLVDNETVHIRFAGGDQIIDTITVPARMWQSSEDRERLWAIHQDGYPMNLSTRNHQITHFPEIPVAQIQPALFRRDVWFLSSSRDRLINTQGDTISAPRGIAHLAALDRYGMWTTTTDGEVLELRGDSLWEAVAVAEAREIGALVIAHIQQEGTFACF